MKTYICTYAQNNSSVHKPFWHALKVYAEENRAKILVVKGHYRNPSSPSEKEEGQWWDAAVIPHLVDSDLQLCPNLRLYGSYRAQPTASHPLTGLNVFVGKHSAIVGHPKRALETIPTATRMPRIVTTTSAVTLPNYSNSRAGAKGEVNHVIGALVVEVEKDGTYFLRHISANDDGSFTDIDRTYCSAGSAPAENPLALVLGDMHFGKEDWAVIRATRRLCQSLKPQHLVLHDCLDFATRNHHDKSKRSQYAKRDKLVKDEVEYAARALTRIATRWGASQIDVVRSNHDEAAERWLDDTKPYEDVGNAPYYHSVWSRCFEFFADTGEWPNVFEMEYRRLYPTYVGGPKAPAIVRFLRRNESLKLADWELGFHGDKGLSGSRGSPAQYAKLGVKSVTGHTHNPRILDGCFTVGVTAKLDHGYNLLPSGWANAHCILHADGRRQMVFVINGKFRGEK